MRRVKEDEPKLVLASATPAPGGGTAGPEGALDLALIERTVERLEQLIEKAGDDRLGAGHGLALLDEAVRLRDGIAGEVRAIRRALDQDRRRHRAHRLYRQGGG